MNMIRGPIAHKGIFENFARALCWSLTPALLLAVAACGGGGDGPNTPPPTTTQVAPLNDTGIGASQCYEAGSDTLVDCGGAGAVALSSTQDGMVGRDAVAATNLNNNGKLGFSFTDVTVGSEHCVQDNVTGLMWEMKTADGGLRDGNNTFTNFGDHSAGDASTLVSQVNGATLCGYSDWRLPTPDELQSIVDYGGPTPGVLIDTNWFPNTQSGSYWTSSPSGYGANYAWYVDYNDGGVYAGIGGDRSFGYYVRLVRGSLPEPTQRYTLSADGQEVTDNLTRLVWRRCFEGMIYDGTSGTCTGTASNFSHEEALQRATNVASLTATAWRLPSIKELSSIIDRSRFYPDATFDSTAFPGTPMVTPNQLWSSTPVIGNSGNAWTIHYDSGGVDSYGIYCARTVKIFVHLVRDAP